MAVTQYSLHAISLTEAETDTVIGQILSQEISFNPEHGAKAADGDVDVSAVALMNQISTASFTTSQVATMLTAIDTTGAPIGTGNTYLTAELYFKKRATGNGWAGTGDMKVVINQGVIFPTTLEVSQDGNAVLGFRIVPSWDGTNDPLSFTTSGVTLPDTSDEPELFGLGPVVVNGTTIDGLTDWSIDFGIQELTHSYDGEAWPRWAGIGSRASTARFSTLHPDELPSIIPQDGVAIAGTYVIFYLRARALGGTFEANATAAHGKLTIYGGVVGPDSSSGSHQEDIVNSYIVTAIKSGENEIVGFTADQAIA